VLAHIGAEGAREERLPDCTALKTWLGLRYDRPAVPPEHVPLMSALRDAVSKKDRRPIGQLVRDVLVQIGVGSPAHYGLFGVVHDEADVEMVREWLAEIAFNVPTHLGVADEIEAAPTTGISLQLIEHSFAVDATDLTWGR
jgi:hypothetical protein